VFDMYGHSCEKLLEFLAVVIILSPISSVCGVCINIDLDIHVDITCIHKDSPSHTCMCHFIGMYKDLP